MSIVYWTARLLLAPPTCDLHWNLRMLGEVITELPSDWIYYAAGVLLLVVNAVAWFWTLYGYPGNWVMLLGAAASAYLLPVKNSELGISWTLVAIVGGMAVLGEFLEFWSGGDKSATEGTGRRTMAFSLGGASLGSVLGAMFGSWMIPIPIVGAPLAALGGACLGACSGVYAAERRSGEVSTARRLFQQAGLVARRLGTVGKLVVGIVMILMITMATFAL